MNDILQKGFENPIEILRTFPQVLQVIDAIGVVQNTTPIYQYHI